MSTEIDKGDYVRFWRIVKPAVKSGSRDSTGKRHLYTVEEATIIAWSGSGLVTSVAKNARKIDGEKVRTARVDAGKPLGMVTAVLDDAQIVGVHGSLFEAARREESVSMYDQGDHA